MDDRIPIGPYLVWEDLGYEGWHPKGYATLDQAVRAESSRDKVVTKLVAFNVVEIDESDEDARS